MHSFNINFLDHVAIRVKDMELSIKWYSRVLGLKKYQLEKWGEFPVFMLSGKSGIAIFPANLEHEKLNLESRHVKIDHFAFNVSNEDFTKAQKHFKSLGETYDFQDHIYFHSIYLKDPDNHTVELTTLLVDEDSFYK
ncbi:VOC family protein [Pontimicrobium aquaticum]|uniref:VOC family protein n=1 Tax=Pontimicrobium aquaticum TaxID=2565367 RepID=A0A4U0EZ70_9FLAO|nr:VOC family protein [Pontimicrobium aquaticum]TJY37343.1 VOC family protein [Pontimicrobium aquaticum]